MTTKSTTSTIPDALLNFDFLPNFAEVRAPIVAALIGSCEATVWRRSRAGTLPAPRKQSERVTTWNVGELRAAMAKAMGDTPEVVYPKAAIRRKAKALTTTAGV